MLTKSNSKMQAEVWSQPNCPACEEAKRLLALHSVQYTTKMIGNGQPYSKKDLLEAVPDARSVPQIFIDNQHIGGLLELKRILNDNNKRATMG